VEQLVLSIFPGMDILGLGFELEGFTVVQGPEFVFGRRVESFHPPASRFDGIIGGDPCQSHSSLANLVRAKGLEPKFPDLTPEFARVIEEARPAWFLRENVPKAPDIKPLGYSVQSFLLDNCWLGEAQMRKRRFWFGWPQERGAAPNLWRWIETATFELPDPMPAVDGGHGAAPWTREKLAAKEQAVCAASRAVPVRLGPGGKVKSTADCSPNRTLAEMLELQGLPPDLLDEAPFTMHAKRKLVGNAVALPTARAIAKAVKEALR
jgi:DNA (cytosine-5)-methyltransferase 1